MSSIPFSSRRYRGQELATPTIDNLSTVFADFRESLQSVKTHHLNPLDKERRILAQFLVRHAVPLRHEKGIRLARRVVQCVNRIFRHPDADLVKMVGNLVDLCRLENDAAGAVGKETREERTLPSRQTCQHFLVAVLRASELIAVCWSHAVAAYAYFSRLLTVGHLVPAFLSFAASAARVAVLTRGLGAVVASWYDRLRPGVHALKGEDADLTAIYDGEEALLPDAAPPMDDDGFGDSARRKSPSVGRTSPSDVRNSPSDIRASPSVVRDSPANIMRVENCLIGKKGDVEDIGEVVYVKNESRKAVDAKKRKSGAVGSENADELKSGNGEAPKRKKKKKKTKEATPSAGAEAEVNVDANPDNKKKGVQTAPSAPVNVKGDVNADGNKSKKKKKKRPSLSQSQEEQLGPAKITKSKGNASEASRFDEIDKIFSGKKRKKKLEQDGTVRARPAAVTLDSTAVGEDSIGKSRRIEKDILKMNVVDEIDDIFGDFL